MVLLTVVRRMFLRVGGVTWSCSASRFCREATNSVSVCRPDKFPVNMSVGSSDLSIPSRSIGGTDGSAVCVCVCVCVCVFVGGWVAPGQKYIQLLLTLL